jgi:hypothetical protein
VLIKLKTTAFIVCTYNYLRLSPRRKANHDLLILRQLWWRMHYAARGRFLTTRVCP